MGMGGQNWSVVLDGSYVGSLSYAGQTLGRDLSAGAHSFYIRDDAHGATSQAITFSIAAGQKLSYTLGTGSGILSWTYDKTVNLSNLRIQLLAGNTVVRLTTDLTVSGYGGRAFEVGGYWLSLNAGTYYFVPPVQGFQFNTPGNYIGHMFYATAPNNAAYTFSPSFDVSASAYPGKSSGTHYYGMFEVYAGTQVASVNASNLTRIGPLATVWITYSATSPGAGEAIVKRADGTTVTLPVAVDIREPAASVAR
jgi:hypothetical protein